MTTAYSDIYDKFMLNINDYRLAALFASSQINFENYLQGWLIDAIVEFKKYCNQDLTARNDTTGTFTETLTDDNKVMLALIMTKYWMEKEVNDITQMRLHLQDHDFKTFAEANNFKTKQDNMIRLEEKVSQKLVDYSYENIDWSSWYAGNFA